MRYASAIVPAFAVVPPLLLPATAHPSQIDLADLGQPIPALRLVDDLAAAPHGPTTAGATLAT